MKQFWITVCLWTVCNNKTFKLCTNCDFIEWWTSSWSKNPPPKIVNSLKKIINLLGIPPQFINEVSPLTKKKKFRNIWQQTRHYPSILLFFEIVWKWDMYLVKIRFGQFKMICVFKSFEEKAIFKFKEGGLFTLLSKKTVCII